jgi:hypothetical protein
MTETLAEKTCAPCRGGIPPLTRDEAQRLQAQAPPRCVLKTQTRTCRAPEERVRVSRKIGASLSNDRCVLILL